MTWPLPSKTSTDFVAPFGAPIKAFLGRSVDSTNAREVQAPVRTFRARTIRDAPELNRIFQIQGARMASYVRDRFFARLAAGEALERSPVGDTLPPDFSFMLPESADAATNGFEGWMWDRTDGQDRLYGFDVDDRGNVYVAYDPYGAGILGPDLRSIHQFRDEKNNALASKHLIAYKAGDRYYLTIDPSFGAQRTYDVTDPKSPIEVVNPLRRNASAQRVPPVEFGHLAGSYFAVGSGYGAVYGIEAVIGAGNIRLYRANPDGSWRRVPCLVPGTNREYFASFYSAAYAKAGGFAGPMFTAIQGGDQMGDVKIFDAAGKTVLVVAAGGLCDFYELEPAGASSTVVVPPLPIAIKVSGKLAVGSLITFSVAIGQGDAVAWHFSDGMSAVGPTRMHRFTTPGVYAVDVEVTHGVAVRKARTAVSIT